MKSRTLTLLLFACVALSLVGCAGTKKLEKEIEALRMQVNTLSADISQLDAQQRDLEQMVKGSSDQMTIVEEAVVVAPVKGGTSSNVYSTPSGFTLQTTTLQKALKNAGYYTGPVDGVAGHQTKDAIRRFQADHGLTTDGICGRKTWAKLKDYSK
jgi:lysozyme family protein